MHNGFRVVGVGRSVNPIQTTGADYAPQTTANPPDSKNYLKFWGSMEHQLNSTIVIFIHQCFHNYKKFTNALRLRKKIISILLQKLFFHIVQCIIISFGQQNTAILVLDICSCHDSLIILKGLFSSSSNKTIVVFQSKLHLESCNHNCKWFSYEIRKINTKKRCRLFDRKPRLAHSKEQFCF